MKKLTTLITVYMLISLIFNASPSKVFSSDSHKALTSDKDGFDLTEDHPASSSVSFVSTSQPAETIEEPSKLYLPLVLDRFPWETIFGVESGTPFDKVSLTGVQWLRIDPQLRWSEVEATKGTYVWNAQLDRSIIDAFQKGFRVILTITQSPEWARKYADRACGPINETYFSDFANFLKAAVERYSNPPYNVDYFMIGNEPDAKISDVGNNGNSVFGCWAEDSDPYYGGEYFGKMLQAVYPSMKQANPQIKVIVGGLLLACDPRLPDGLYGDVGYCPDSATARKWNFFEGVVRQAGSNFDIVAFHGYAYFMEGENPVYSERNKSMWYATGGVVDGKINYLRDVMSRYGINKPIMETESAVLYKGEGIVATTDAYENAKADYLVYSYANTWSQGLTASIWYAFTGWNFSGLVDQNSNPVPAYYALQTMTDTLGSAEFSYREDLNGFTKFAFQTKTDEIWLLVPTGQIYGTEYSITTPANFKQATNLFGETYVVNGDSISFTRPVYLFIGH